MPKDKIYLIQDCDVDGLSSCALAYLYLLHLGLPHDKIKVLYHTDKKHGLTDNMMAQIGDDCSLLWITDAGSNDIEQCKILQDRDIKIIISDHHQSLKNPYATVINNQLSPNVTNKNLAGVGVTFKFIQYCCMKQNDNWYKKLLDIVALGNLGDVMDMRVLENRAFNKWGLRNIKNPFLQALCDKLIVKGEINPKAIVWSVVPKLNAVQRSNNQQLKQLLLECFVGARSDYDRVIDLCVEQYKEQGKITDKMFNDLIQANSPNSHKIMIIQCEKSGYTGLIANKLMEYYNKPIFLVHLENGEFKGSCRSEFDILQNIKSSGLVTFAEGHDNVFGLGWLEQNTQALQDYCDTLNLTQSDKDILLSLNVQQQIPNHLFGVFEGYDDVWAKGIEKPQFHLYNIRLSGSEIKLAKNGKTIMFIYNGIKYIKFNTNKQVRENLCIGESTIVKLEILGELNNNFYMGRIYPQVIIESLEIDIVDENNVDINDVF